MKILNNSFIKTILILIIGTIVGVLLLVGVYLLPTGRMERNVRDSLPLLERETSYIHLLPNVDMSELDNFTDALMLNNAVYKGNESAVDKAMHVYLDKVSDSTNMVEALRNHYTLEKPIDKSAYTRYWHGYLVFLKPLLMLFSYENIRVLNSLFQPLLVILIAILFYKKQKEKYILPYIFSLFMLSPFTVMFSMQFSTIFYITNIAVASLLLFNDKLKEKNYYKYFFLIVGMLTSYFDLLTYPLVAFGLPMIVYLILREEKDLFNSFKDFIINSIMWVVGYLGLWAAKITVGSILTGENFFRSAVGALKTRTSFEVVSSKITTDDEINKNFNIIFNKPHILLLILLAIYVIYLIIKFKPKVKKNNIIKIIPFLLLVPIPYMWYFVASNHSFIHAFFAYRIQIITVFAFFAGVIYFIEKGIVTEDKKSKKKKS